MNCYGVTYTLPDGTTMLDSVFCDRQLGPVKSAGLGLQRAKSQTRMVACAPHVLCAQVYDVANLDLEGPRVRTAYGEPLFSIAGSRVSERET